jgi:hypothetical protein
MEKLGWGEISIIVGSIVGFVSGLFSIIFYFIKKWAKAREDYENNRDQREAEEKKERDKKEAAIRCELVSTTANIAHDLAEKHSQSVKEIKEKIESNHISYAQNNEEIKCSLDALATQVRAANGRTGKNEIDIAVLTAIIKDRAETGLKPSRKKKEA